MFLFKKHLSRRTVLKGAGATIALPLLDAMVPAGTALAQTRRGAEPAPGLRLLPAWRAPGRMARRRQTGRDFDFPFILKPLEPFRDYVTVVSGLRNKGGESSSPHGIIEETWLNCVGPAAAQREDRRRRDGGSDRGEAPRARTRRCRRWNCAASRAA